METSILTSTQKYAASALFALALHHSQVHQKRPTNPLPSLKDEPIGEGASTNKTISVSDNSQLWIHEHSGLLLPIFRVMGVDYQAWDGLKETAGVSTQARHHVGSENDGGVNSSEKRDKELAMLKVVDATLSSMEISSVICIEDIVRSRDYEIKCLHRYGCSKKELSGVDTDPNETTEGATFHKSEEGKKHIDGSGSRVSEEQKQTATFYKSDADEGKKDIAGSGSRVSEKQMEEGELLTEDRKVTVIYELLSACIADNVSDLEPKGYDARHRTALRLLATWLNVKWIKVEAIEAMVACSLMDTIQLKNEDEKSTKSDWTREGMIGAAALTGGTLMAISGGIAAPAIANGLGALAPTLGSIVPGVGAGGFAAAASATGSVTGSVAFAASFGAAGAGLAGSKMAKRTAGLDEFEFQQCGKDHKGGRLAVGIFVSGIISEEEDFLKPWKDLNDNLERYVLKWETKNLTALNSAVQEWLTSSIATNVIQGGAMLTVLSTLVTALTLPAALVTAAQLIDNAWAIAVDRSDKAGKALAEVLMDRLQGNRPVTLIGFSLGARVIFKCLRCLAETKGDNAGLVERVVLLGAPIPINDEKWEDARKMVAGRFINVYSTNDWTLGIIFRASILSAGLAGIQPVDLRGIENVDATERIDGHSSYLWMTKKLLRKLDLDYYYPISETTTDAKPQEEKSKKT